MPAASRKSHGGGDFVGVVAEREWDAVRAARDLKVTWQETTALPGNSVAGKGC